MEDFGIFTEIPEHQNFFCTKLHRKDQQFYIVDTLHITDQLTLILRNLALFWKKCLKIGRIAIKCLF